MNNPSIIFSDQELPSFCEKSIFLEGPSLRRSDQIDWKRKAVEILKSTYNFDGTIFVPIPEKVFYGLSELTQSKEAYINQIDWEIAARNRADLIVCWVPRDIDNGMPGFTTNVEFGIDHTSGKMLYGRPDSAQKCGYLDELAKKQGLAIYTSIDNILKDAVSILGNGSPRLDGEATVPLFIWKSAQFQSWYTSLKKNGNKLIDSKVLHHFKLPNGALFSFVLWVNVWVESEQRFKSNEFVFSRRDTSSVVAFYEADESQKFVVLTNEFRSPVNNASGFVKEIPSGSSACDLEQEAKLMVAQHELHEETGLLIKDLSRFKQVATKQVCATLSTHKSSLFSVVLNNEEFKMLIANARSKKVLGVQQDTEQITLEIANINDLPKLDIDFSTLGMIYCALKSLNTKIA